MLTEKRSLGDILLQAGVLSPDDLTQALAVQQVSGRRLGEVLVAMGSLTESDVAAAVAGQLGMPFLPDHEIQVDFQAASLIPPALAKMTNALPLREEHGRLLVAMSDPLDVFSLDEIRHLTRRSLQPVACTPQGVLIAIAQYERLFALKQRDNAVEVATGTAAVIHAEADDAPVVRLVNELLDRALAEGASDIHVEPDDEQFRIRFRVDGFLRHVLSPSMANHASVVARIKVLSGLDISERRIPQDGRLELRDKGRNVDVRISTLPTVFGEKVVMRLFNRARALPRLQELGLLPVVLQEYIAAIRRPNGMVLVTGPTGSGKSSTLMSTLAFINSDEKNIVTIEDPVEYQLKGVNQVQVSSRIGLGFADGLRSILRQDPNVIMVGEIRDGETADVAVRAALTGHLVLSTLHTNDAAGALTRLTDMGVEPYLIASSIVGVAAQRLIRRICSHCRQPYTADSGPLRLRGCQVEGEQVTLFRAIGCSRCHGTGYAGRFAIFEFLRITEAIQERITGRRAIELIREQAYAEGMQPLITNGLQRVVAGETTPEEVLRVVAASGQSPQGVPYG